MPRYGAAFAPWPWTVDGYSGMTVSERKRIDKIKKALRFIFSECSEHIVEQAIREELREDEIRDLAAMLLTSLTLEEGPLLPVSDVHEDTLLDDSSPSYEPSRARYVTRKDPPERPFVCPRYSRPRFKAPPVERPEGCSAPPSEAAPAKASATTLVDQASPATAMVEVGLEATLPDVSPTPEEASNSS